MTGQDQLIRLLKGWERWRRVASLPVWLVRGALVGFVVMLLLALVSRVRPIFTPAQLAIALALTTVIALSGAALLVMGWRRSNVRIARYFDHLFGLQERISTALELYAANAEGTLPALQTDDALTRAAKFDARAALPLRIKWREAVGALALCAVCLFAIYAPNPQTTALAQQAAISSAIQQQIAKIEQIKQQIQADTRLSTQDKAALTQLLDEAAQRLAQPGITRAEAVATLNDLQQKLVQNQGQLTPNQQQALQGAGQALGQGIPPGNVAAQQAAQGLQNGNLNQAAQGLQNLSNQLNSLDAAQQKALAESLQNAAKALEGTNPQAAQAMQQAAQALQAGDLAAAQKALQQAAQALRNQQQAAAGSPGAQAAQAAARQLTQGQQEVAQAGAPDPAQQGQQSAQNAQSAQTPQPISTQSGAQPTGQAQAGQPQAGQPQPGQPQQGQPQPGQPQQGQPQAGQPQPGQPQQGQPQPGQGQPQAGQPQPGQGQPQAGQPQPGQGQPGQGQPQAGSQGGTGQGAAEGGGGAGDPSAPPGQLSAGTGSSTGSDTTGGQPGQPGGTGSINGGTGDGTTTQTDRVYAPSFIGGQGGATINPQGPAGQPGDRTNQPVYTDPTTGAAMVPINDVISAASAQAANAADSEYVPLGLRGVIHDYFSGLQPAK